MELHQQYSREKGCQIISYSCILVSDGVRKFAISLDDSFNFIATVSGVW